MSKPRQLTRGSWKGKPAPDCFAEGARLLRVEPSRAAVIEDAVVGVVAGHAGGFALVIGAGADLVLGDLDEAL